MPLVEERYFFAIARETLESKAMQEMLSIMRSDEFIHEINQLGGYDATETGKIHAVSDVFRLVDV